MDMWDPYIASVREHVPEADGKTVFDKFHVAQHLGNAVDKVRRKENKTLKASGTNRTSFTPSTSTAAASTWPQKPLNSRKRLLFIADR
jgi:transposase